MSHLTATSRTAMSAASARSQHAFAAAELERHEGWCLLSAADALLKGLFESDRQVHMLTGPGVSSAQGGLGRVLERAGNEQVAELLRQHGTTVQVTGSAQRSLHLAMRRARAGDVALALVPNDALAKSADALREAAAIDGGGLCVVLEDSPSATASPCPREFVMQMGMACIEPADLTQLRDSIEHALRLGRAGGCTIGVILHESLLRSTATLEARPNRVMSMIDMPLAKRRRRQRLSEAGGVLRMARRLELNAVTSMPSPGERVPVGFVTVGPADAALRHLTHTLQLQGRVATLQLGLLHPLDMSLLERFLCRCQRVVVLEARPGCVESQILAAAEIMRHNSRTPASVWGRTMPAESDQANVQSEIGSHLHPSTLARSIIHLLHPLRPTLRVASRLAQAPPMPMVQPPPRGAGIGDDAAKATVRRMLADVDQRLKAAEAVAAQGRSISLSIEGWPARGSADRVVPVELWHAEEFSQHGGAAVTHVASSRSPAMLIVVDVDGERGDFVERQARAYIEPQFAEHIVIVPTSLGDRAELREALYQAAINDLFTIVIVHDGSPPQYSLPRIEQDLAEIDMLGFQPRQWITRPAEQICEIRSTTVSDSTGSAESPRGGEPAANPAEPMSDLREDVMQSAFAVEKLSRRHGAAVRLKVQPLLEQVQVVRTRPPAWIWRNKASTRLDLPAPRHARQSAWRAHLAGVRGGEPGLAARVLRDAGRIMGYDVRMHNDPTFIGAGRRAWTQMLFTQRTTGEAQLPIVGAIPYGEADLLLGLDRDESVRAISPNDTLRVAHADRTCAVVNCGWFDADRPATPPTPDRTAMEQSINATCRDDDVLVEDFAAACRMWFYTDRVADLAMLGAAFQRGFVPVRLDAVETALRRLEAAGVGRAVEAFEFGRRLTVDQRLLRRPHDDGEEDLARVTRRMILSVRRTRLGGRTRARRFRRLLEQSLASMPGLSETTPGRQARRDLVAGLYRCLEWGGQEYAARYGNLLMDLYSADRGDRGRMITRCAVLPLAEAMLIRDQVYTACMAASPEQRRRFRMMLNVKQSRGDEVERRYLTRLELVAFRRRFQADVRTSDWPARMAKASRQLLPQRWRGSRRDRELRQYIIDFIQRARHGMDRDYDTWSEAMQRLHHQAAERRLRNMALPEVRMLVEPAG